jgi:uncharacterized membrane protein YagU involved in acid resistance
MNRNLSGLYSGLIATGPMTLFMMGAHEELPEGEKSPFPPATLSLELLDRALHRPSLSQNQQSALTVLSHFSYGSAAGVLYSQTFGRLPGPALARGVAYGAAFWAANYLGLSPMMRMRANAPEMPKRRNAMMFGAHLVWGAALGFAEDRLRRSGKEMLAGARQAPSAE